jgi:hypothetical protein
LPVNPKATKSEAIKVTVSTSSQVESDELTVIEVKSPPLATIVTLAVL